MDARPFDAGQPLLRDPRLVHPAPREAVRRSWREADPGRQAGQGPDERQGQRVHPEPHLRSDHRPGLPRPALPGSDPRGRRPALADAGRAARQPPGVPGPGGSPEGDGRAGPGCRAPLPDLRLRRRAGTQGRHPRHHGHPLGVQPVARGGLGLRPRGPALRCRHALLRRPRRRRRRGRLAARARRAPHPRPSRPRARRERGDPVPRRQAPRPRVGADRRSRCARRLPPG